MSEGAIGLSSGLEYEVGSYSDTKELVALAAVAAKHGGFYMSHIRDEADRAFEAFQEAIAIGEQAHIPVQISHIKLGTVGVWRQAAQAVALIEDGAEAGRRRDRRLLSRTTRGIRPSRCSCRTSTTTIPSASARRWTMSAARRT